MRYPAKTAAANKAPARMALAVWLLFSIGWLYGAWCKPFHVDEFYSWMYSWRCSFRDILLLREFGIGHPPPYHLLQKIIQTLTPLYHPLLVRVANYCIGSVFVVVFTVWGLKHSRAPLLCAAACLSATVFEVFIFSRMWGLVFLAVFLLYRAGERCARTGAPRDLVVFCAACLCALMADYGSSIVVLPYAVLVLVARRQQGQRVAAVFVMALTLAWAAATRMDMPGAAPGAYAYRLVHDFGTVVLKTGNILYNFWFLELFALGMAVFGLAVGAEYVLRCRDAGPDRQGGAGMVRRLAEQVRGLFDIRRESGRLLLTILSAWIMLLAVSPVFWRTLLNKKYLVVILPLCFIYMAKNLRPGLLRIPALMLVLSGGMYLFSNRMVEWYPPQVFDAPHPVVFENEFACANHYLRRGLIIGEEPVLADFSMFEKYCRVCRIGTDVLDAEGFDTVQFVGLERSEIERAKVFKPPPGFVPAREEGVRLTRLDRLQFRYLTPIPKQRFMVYTYVRENAE